MGLLKALWMDRLDRDPDFRSAVEREEDLRIEPAFEDMDGPFSTAPEPVLEPAEGPSQHQTIF
jgi:hypothetical protein